MSTREQRGRLVRETWVAYCLETGDTKPSHIAPWDDISEWDKEADRRIGDALAAVLPVPSAEVRAAMRRITSGMHALKRQGVFENPNTFVADLDRIDAYLAALEDAGERGGA